MDHTQALPDDLLADILRRLPPRDLAASRCVRKAWLAVVDGNRLLPSHVFPHSVCGLYINYIDYEYPHLFARPSAQPEMYGNLSLLPDYPILDHCNGLLLCRLMWWLRVVNPATRRWEDVPWEDRNANPHLVFDPTSSPHYEVFLIPQVPEKVFLSSPAHKTLTKSQNLGEFSGPFGLIDLFSLPNDESADEAIQEDGFEDGSTESQNLGEFSGPYGLIELFSLPNDESANKIIEEDGFEDGSTESQNLGEFSDPYGLIELFSLANDESADEAIQEDGFEDGSTESQNLEEFSEPYGLIELFSLPNDESTGKAIQEDGFEDGSMEERHKQKSDFWTSSESTLFESRGEQEDRHDLIECPPSVWTLKVFSSSSRQWQTRSFVREGEAARTITNAFDPLDPICFCLGGPRWRNNVYWQGSLYVHYGAFVVRLSLSDRKYQVIKVPMDIEKTKDAQFLGKSEKGVYLAKLNKSWQLWVWTLTESSGQIHWLLKHHVDLKPLTRIWLQGHEGFDKTWTIVDDEYVHCRYYDNEEEEDRGWNSDDDNVLNIDDYEACYLEDINFLGFHPYKEVVFLGLRLVGVAYHLKSSKVQYLGEMRPKGYNRSPTNGIYESYPYTPCMSGELLKHD